MSSKEFIQNQLDITKATLKENENGFSKETIVLYEEDIKQYNQVLKALEELEELKKIMGTPIQDIMKRLKVLEIFKKILMLTIVIGVDKVDAEIPSDKIIFKLDELNNEEKDMLWDWLREWLNE